MSKHRVMHIGDAYVIQRYYRGKWADLGEAPTLDKAKKLLKDFEELDKIL